MIALSIAIPALIAQTTIMMILIGAIAIAITYFFHKKGALQ